MRRINSSAMLGLVTAALLLVPLAGATHATEGLPNEGCAVTKGGWGAGPSGHNPGALLHEWFDELYPAGLTVGDLFFPTAQSVTDFLPNGGTNVETQAVALELNIDFGGAGLLGGTIASVEASSGNTSLDGKTAVEILEIAEDVLLTDPTPSNSEYSDLIDVMSAFNEEQFGCDALPPPCPDNVMAIAEADGSITISWGAVADADAYNVYRATGAAGSFVFLDSTTNTTYNDDTTAVGQLYRYIVTAVVDEVESQECDEVQATAIPFFPGAILGAVALVGAVGAMTWFRRRA